ncbi:hypothetical protein QGN23_01490 [Chryseobacterium gotjawalense]|uniref:Lipoprotein n=1 Tax=Chryseobacterium gotjawalense TaxID=3042315 RepID=A0ABY8RDM1_9FLAO|nr:hypothetical protein [Chryseobacterium sp. wdc7]WHF51961.1 hypothetical protein QGN23_01490 [Chryseobacterium sp. wdc7]
MINKKSIILLLLSIISCNKKDLTITSIVNNKDSTLILEVQNSTNKNFLVEFPTINNFLYEDEFNNIGPENFTPITIISEEVDSIDFKKFIALKCNNIIIDSLSLDKTAKLVERESKKTYYYKLKGYKKGRILLLQDSGVSEFVDKKNLKKLINRSCGGYEYFTGSFEFIPKKIILP